VTSETSSPPEPQADTVPASPSATSNSALRPPDAPTLGPRPVYRPAVDGATSRAFGRPEGLPGAFAPIGRRVGAAPGTSVRPPDPILAEAFGRPPGSVELIQRDPYPVGPRDSAEAADPWRDPESIAMMGAPALSVPTAPVLPPATKLSVREVLFGSRVAPKALAALGGLALAIGLIGGLIGALLGNHDDSLTSKSVSLVQSGDSNRPMAQITRVVDQVMPSVVSIQVVLGDQQDTGSGVVIDGQGYIVTNNHVISMAATDATGQAKITVQFADGTVAPGRIVGRDTKTDIAVLKVEVDRLTVAQLGKSDDVQVGENVIAVGSPLGLARTVTSGIVSALHRAVPLNGEESDTDAVIDAVQTDAAINPGNSGGPLLDFSGRVIGINAAIRSESGGSVGLGFAIPIDTVARIAQALIHDGSVHHAELGVNASEHTVDNGDMVGARVDNVVVTGAAAKAGIVEGDIIVKVGDRKITSNYDLTVAVRNHQIGDTVPIELVRNGRVVDIPATLGSD
jgi:S1-C subfamily serine protease